jgi:hypothetical protein
VALDPVYADPNAPTVLQRTWRPYFNLVARLDWVNFSFERRF